MKRKYGEQAVDPNSLIETVFEELEAWRLKFVTVCKREPTMREMFMYLPVIQTRLTGKQRWKKPLDEDEIMNRVVEKLRQRGQPITTASVTEELEHTVAEMMREAALSGRQSDKVPHAQGQE